MEENKNLIDLGEELTKDEAIVIRRAWKYFNEHRDTSLFGVFTKKELEEMCKRYSKTHFSYPSYLLGGLVTAALFTWGLYVCNKRETESEK